MMAASSPLPSRQAHASGHSIDRETMVVISESTFATSHGFTDRAPPAARSSPGYLLHVPGVKSSSTVYSSSRPISIRAENPHFPAWGTAE